MDKRVIFATAGSGKTTYIINNLSCEKRTLIVTYTTGNYMNLQEKILIKFNNIWPENITLMSYFSFLYTFCFKPFLSEEMKNKGIDYNSVQNQYAKRKHKEFYFNKDGQIYSCRLALLLEDKGVVEYIKQRLIKYFDEFIIDEIQDISGRDFNFLELLMETNIKMLFVGDFYQHTFMTSHDGNVNKNLFDDINKYEKRFENKHFVVDKSSLLKSWRCSQEICDFVNNNLGINISSNLSTPSIIQYIDDSEKIKEILGNNNIIKLHYQNSNKYGYDHKNWGDTKGEDKYGHVCILLNKTTLDAYKKNNLSALPQSTKNKLYVAITRAHGNVYFINESECKKR